MAVDFRRTLDRQDARLQSHTRLTVTGLVALAIQSAPEVTPGGYEIAEGVRRHGSLRPLPSTFRGEVAEVARFLHSSMILGVLTL